MMGLIADDLGIAALIEVELKDDPLAHPLLL